MQIRSVCYGGDGFFTSNFCKNAVFLTVWSCYARFLEKMHFFMKNTGLLALIIFAVSFILSLTMVALVLRLSHRKKWYDEEGGRKIHEGDIPRLGGLGFAPVFILVVAAICFIAGEIEPVLRYLSCFFALILVLFFGVFDDFRSLRPRTKLIVQVIAALFVIIPGFIFNRVTYDFIIFPVPLWYVITFVWIIGSTNAFNLIDGLDGLAGGLSGLIALFMGLIFFLNGGVTYKVLFCVALVGVTLGFLVFNAPVPKAKIFMGDGGSQFFGFLLALLPLLGEREGTAALPILYVAALFIIPIFDTIAAIWRRLRDGHKVDTPDKSHVHHKLMNMGLSVQGVIAVLYGLQIILGVLVFVSTRLDGLNSLYVLSVAYIIGGSFFAVVHYKNKLIKNGKKT